MNAGLPLVENEILKLFRRRRFRLVLLILAALNGLIVFAQVQVQARQKGPRKEWRVEVQERIARTENWLRSGRVTDTWRRWGRFEIGRLQYHLDHDINPEKVSGPLYTRGFANAGSLLLLPLLAIVLASDIVSSEFSEGTIKLLLTRPVTRSRVLAAKAAALLLAITLTVLAGGLLAYLFSGLAYGFSGWGAPVLSGFRLAGEAVDLSAIRALPLWQDTALVFGLAWFSALCVGAIAFFTSVVLRSTAAAMGSMVAALIAGTILPRLAPEWESQKYLFVTHLPLPDIYSGSPPPIEGITLIFSVVVLAAWAAAALLAAFGIFRRRDVLA
jgi:ABC-2 type transport system permease protein